MWKIDTTQTGIPSIFREYEWLALDYIYEQRKEITTKSTSDYINDFKKISRASIHNFIQKMVDAEILGYEEVSGKGGFHREHYVLVEREDLPRKIALDTIETLRSVFPGDPFIQNVQTTAQNIIPISDKPR